MIDLNKEDKKDDRRRHISFKNNQKEDELLKHCDKQSEKYGLSTYIKLLIQKDKEEKIL